MNKEQETLSNSKNHNWLYMLLAVVLLISNLLITWFAAAEIEKYIPQWTQPIIGFGLVLIIALNAIGWLKHYR
ncbi:MAG: hypothetical protein GX963_09240 [Bacteroidales bacterium]|nr:hypothetical protein [Bacteroidales bacterium]